MALEVRQATITVPAGTAKASPHIATISLDNRDIAMIDLEVPPGPSGLMGFYLGNNGVQWVPRDEGEWIVWDDYTASWPLTDQPDASGWEITGYNEDDYNDHAVIIRFHVNLPVQAQPAEPTITFQTEPAPREPVAL